MLTLHPTKQPEETLTLLQTLLPTTLTFARKPIPAVSAPPPTPSTPRSPSLAARATTSTDSPPDTPTPEQQAAVAIFGSVSTTDILSLIREQLLEADPSRGGRVALEAESVEILGLDEGEDRIKHLGTFEVLITAGKDLKPVSRTVEVVAEE